MITRRHLGWLAVLLPAAGLAGCGPSRPDADQATAAGAGVLRARTDGRPPSNLPEFLAVYPGARITSSVDGGPRGGTVTFSSMATPNELAAYYRARAQAAGLHPKTDVSAGDVRILMFDDAPRGRRSFVLTLTSRPDGVQAAVTYGPQGQEVQ